MTVEAIHRADVASVRFAIYPDGMDGPRILAEISDDALRELFGARDDADALVAACRAHFAGIEAVALERYRMDPRRPVRLDAHDFEGAGRIARHDAAARDRPA
jgi:hypothetical protein